MGGFVAGLRDSAALVRREMGGLTGALPGALAGGGGGGNVRGGGVTLVNPVFLARDTDVARQLASIVTPQQRRTIGYAIE